MSVEVVAALRAKGTELALECDALLRKAEALAADITALDRAIAILDPTQANAVASGRKRQKGASSLDGIYGRGEFQRVALEAIRTATGSISAHGILRDMAVRKGLVLDDYPTPAASRNGSAPCSDHTSMPTSTPKRNKRNNDPLQQG